MCSGGIEARSRAQAPRGHEGDMMQVCCQWALQMDCQQDEESAGSHPRAPSMVQLPCTFSAAVALACVRRTI